jgi:putative membrane protein
MFGHLVMLLIFFGIGVAIFLAIRSSSHRIGGRDHGAKSSALAILEERFARGEIDREEFEERRKVLSE